jgi:hypothetical protein
MNPPEDSSLLAVLSVLKEWNPDLLAMFRARTEDEFLEAAERAVERAIKLIEGGAKKYAVLDELGLSTMLANLLTQAGLPTEAEGYHNGHVDVRIHHFDRGRFQYLGECKIHDGFRHHCNGCAQVLGYGSGRDKRVLCMDFFKVAEMYRKLNELREWMDRERPLRQISSALGHFIRGAFVTEHEHSSGARVQVLHLGCSVHVDSRAGT